MGILETVKQALGIYYTEQVKDLEIMQMIAGAKDFLRSAGWPSDDLENDAESPLAVQAIITNAKMAINTDPTEMRINPMLIAMIGQARTSASEETE